MPDADDLRLSESDSGIDLSRGNVCAMCGAQNNGNQSHCWQCKSLLLQTLPRGHMTPGSAKRSQRHLSGISHQLDGKYFLTAFAVLIGAVALGSYFTYQSAQGLYPAPRTVTDFIRYHMSTTRIVLGAVAILLAPLLLNISLRILSVQPRCSGNRVALIAFIPPGMAFLLSWLHPAAFAATLILPAIVLWVLYRRGMSLSAQHATSVGMTHVVLTALLLAFSGWALESLQAERPLNPLVELRSLDRALDDLRAEDVMTTIQGESHAPLIHWKPTNSNWLDFRANRAQIEVRGDYPDDQVVQLIEADSEQAVLTGEFDGSVWRSPVFAPHANTTYGVRISGGIITGTQVRVRSLVPASL